MMTKKSPKIPKKFYCEKCDYTTSNKKDFDKHLLTRKHQNSDNRDKKSPKIPKNPQNFVCDCGNVYKYRQGLSHHKKTCTYVDTVKEHLTSETDVKLLTNLIMDVVKHNSDLTSKIVDLCKTNTSCHNSTVIANNVISNNNTNTFNLNLFLNEKCKDAMNINDFVDSIQLDLDDLEYMGRLGYVEGISNIIVRNLKALDVTERPIHCADKKREVIYIKDEDKWEKEDEDKKKLRKAIKRVAYKNEKLLPKYKETYPDYKDYYSNRSDQYSKIVIETLGGEGNNDREKEAKIMKKIAKEVVIDKTIM